MDLEKIKEEIEKTNNNERLKIEKTEDVIKKVLEEFKTKNTEELQWNLRFLTLKYRFFKSLSDYEEKRKAREIMGEIDIFETNNIILF